MEQLRRSGEVSITNDGATKTEVLQPAAKMLDTTAPNEEAGGPKVGKGRQQILMHGTGNDDLVLEIVKVIRRVTASRKGYSPEELKALDLSNVISKGESSSALVVQDDEEVDEEGVVPQDIEVVMCHTAVSRPKAVKALKAADGDIVSAIMELVS